MFVLAVLLSAALLSALLIWGGRISNTFLPLTP